ncbi:RIP metalloprotease RseP [Rhodobacterales bacterium HKCCE3408]|nr:RIP metalloprotease RseP [Rhodobacterales bacterium HKCCE3408]
MDFIPDFGNVALTILAFVVALSVIVAIHEYGHYIVGRWSGIRAEVFSIGFGPVLFSRVDKRGTRWQIAALPFGGYVKFLGDTSAASDRPDEATLQALTPEVRRQTMHGAPLWARAATVAAGPVFNFILSILIFGAFLFFTGRTVEEARIGPLRDLPQSYALLQEGDLVTAVDGMPVEALGELVNLPDEIELRQTLTYTVERDGQTIETEAVPPVVPYVAAVTPQSAANSAGLRPGDVILEVDGQPIHAFAQLRPLVEAAAGEPLTLSVWHDGETREVTLSPRRTDMPTPEGGFETRWLIGITGATFFELVTEPVGPLAATEYGVGQTWFIVKSSLSGLWHMVTLQIDSCNLQGPIGIAETSGAAARQGVDNFIWFIAVLSTAVGLLNLFPIPVLDGGHLVFHAYEALAGTPPPERAMRVAMSVGLTILLSLMLFATFNDVFC